LEQKLSKVYKKNNFKRKTSDFRVFKGQESSLTKIWRSHPRTPWGPVLPVRRIHVASPPRPAVRSFGALKRPSPQLQVAELHGMPEVKDEKNHLPVAVEPTLIRKKI